MQTAGRKISRSHRSMRLDRCRRKIRLSLLNRKRRWPGRISLISDALRTRRQTWEWPEPDQYRGRRKNPPSSHPRRRATECPGPRSRERHRRRHIRLSQPATNPARPSMSRLLAALPHRSAADEPGNECISQTTCSVTSALSGCPRDGRSEAARQRRNRRKETSTAHPTTARQDPPAHRRVGRPRASIDRLPVSLQRRGWRAA